MIKSSIRYDEFIKIIWILFLVIFLVDIGGGFYLKDLATLLLVMILAALLLEKGAKLPFEKLAIDILVLIVFPGILIGYSIVFKGIPLGDTISQSTAFISIIILFFIVQIKNKKYLIDSVFTVMILFPLLVIVTFIVILLLHYTGMDSMIDQLNRLANRYNLGYIGVNPLGNQIGIFIPNVYYKWSMLLIPITLIYFFGNKINFSISLVASLMTLSTGVILFVGLGILILYVISIPKFKMKTIFWGIPLLVAGVYLLLQFGILELLFSKLTSDSDSTNVKIEHIYSIVENVTASIHVFLFGMGVGSSFFTTGFNEYSINVEVSHLNLIRQFGMVYFCIFSIYVAVTCRNLYVASSIGKKLSIGLLMLFLCAGTNPLLISPVFFIWLFICRGYLILPQESVKYD